MDGKRRFCTYLGGYTYRLRNINYEGYPLRGNVSRCSNSLIHIKETEDGLGFEENIDKDSDEFIFVPDLEGKSPEVLEMCKKALPEYLLASICSDIYLLKDGEEKPSSEVSCGEITYDIHLKLFEYIPEHCYFKAKAITKEEFEEGSAEYQNRDISAYNVKYDLKDLVFVRWDLYGKGDPRTWCNEATKQGLELIKWEGHPIGDCIFMLFKHNGKKLPDFPAGDHFGDEKRICHRTETGKKILTYFPEYVKPIKK